MELALRVDHDVESVIAHLDAKKYGGFGVREVVKDNEHYHFLVIGDIKSERAFRMALTRACTSLKGNGSYSVSVVKDLDKYERYMCKGDAAELMPQLVWRAALKYDNDMIKSLHDLYWESNKVLKKRSTTNMIDFVVDEAKRRCVKWTDRSELAEIYVDEIVARDKPLNKFAAKAVINTVQLKLCPDDTAKKQMVYDI